jgi:hypothetical protein
MKTIVFLCGPPKHRKIRTVYICAICGKTYPNVDGIVVHARKTGHMEGELNP